MLSYLNLGFVEKVIMLFLLENKVYVRASFWWLNSTGDVISIYLHIANNKIKFFVDTELCKLYQKVTAS